MVQASKAVQRISSGPVRWLVFGLIAFVFVLFGVILWFAYVDGYATDVAGEPKVVEAEPSPFRRQPEDPGGMQIANEGSQIAGVYSQDQDSPGDERVLDPEPPLETTSLEQFDPLLGTDQPDDSAQSGEATLRDAADEAESPFKAAADSASSQNDSRQSAAEEQLSSPGDAVSVTELGSESSTDALGEDNTENIDSLIAAADEIIASVDSRLAQPNAEALSNNNPAFDDTNGEQAGSANTGNELAAASGTSEATDAVGSDQPSAEANEAEANEAVANAQQTEQVSQSADQPTATERPAELSTAAAIATEFRVQLAAFRTTNAATSAWNDFRRRYQGELEGLSPTVQPVDTSGGTLYRLQAGPYESRPAALASCERIKLLGGDCFVIEPRS